MVKKETTLLTEEKLKELYLTDNLTVKEIAENFNIGTATVNRKLKQYNIKKSEEQRRLAISKTKQSKTEEEKLLYSQHISEARKGKGKGVAPWNKGTKGLQEAWNKGISTPGRPRSSESLEKARQTCLERYGVEWACQRQEARLKGQNSSANISFEESLIENNLCYEREFPIGSFSYDFKVGKYLIEIDPYATHNSTWGIRSNPPKSAGYHKQKSDLAKEKGYFCIHKFDWDDTQKIAHLLKQKKQIGARKCQVKEVAEAEAKEFINQYHLQNYAKDTVRLGLYYENNLVSIMTFGKPRYNKKYDYELVRYCSTLNVIGGGEKLFTYFVSHYKPASVISYCDEAKFKGNIYVRLGFELIRAGRPARHWYNPKTKQHITDNLLRQRGFDQLFRTNYGKDSSNEELMLKHDFVEIYDCGQATYVWYSKE
jgi:predicted DNA-binding protein YlxM (UPF0122 family)